LMTTVTQLLHLRFSIDSIAAYTTPKQTKSMTELRITTTHKDSNFPSLA
jgi:hypothetical protein